MREEVFAQSMSRAKKEAQWGLMASRFEFPPHRFDQALLGCRGGPMKNKSNDPAAVIRLSAARRPGSQSHVRSNLLKSKNYWCPGEYR
jgi:hypothetical protein